MMLRNKNNLRSREIYKEVFLWRNIKVKNQQCCTFRNNFWAHFRRFSNSLDYFFFFFTITLFYKNLVIFNETKSFKYLSKLFPYSRQDSIHFKETPAADVYRGTCYSTSSNSKFQSAEGYRIVYVMLFLQLA